MNYVSLLVPLLTLCAGGVGGYYAGRYTRGLLNEIRTLREEKSREPAPKPGVTMGEYTPPQPVSTAVDTKRAVGLVEQKTPERVDWETTQAIEREALHIGPQ